MRRARRILNITAGTLLGVFGGFELLLGMGCKFTTSTIRISASAAEEVRACAGGVAAEGRYDVDDLADGGLEISVSRPGVSRSAWSSTVRDAVSLSLSLARSCGVPARSMELEGPQDRPLLGFVQSPL